MIDSAVTRWVLKGSKIRSSYIAFAQKEKKRLKAEITKQEAAVQVAKEELKKAEEKTETMEAAMGATIERRKASREFSPIER